jgi:hypothetical protein
MSVGRRPMFHTWDKKRSDKAPNPKIHHVVVPRSAKVILQVRVGKRVCCGVLKTLQEHATMRIYIVAHMGYTVSTSMLGAIVVEDSPPQGYGYAYVRGIVYRLDTV